MLSLHAARAESAEAEFVQRVGGLGQRERAVPPGRVGAVPLFLLQLMEIPVQLAHGRARGAENRRVVGSMSTSSWCLDVCSPRRRRGVSSRSDERYATTPTPVNVRVFSGPLRKQFAGGHAEWRGIEAIGPPGRPAAMWSC